MKEEEAATTQRAVPPLSRSLPSLLDEFDDHVVLKAVRGRRIVGLVRAKWRAGTCRIGRLVVYPDVLGQGSAAATSTLSFLTPRWYPVRGNMYRRQPYRHVSFRQ